MSDYQDLVDESNYYDSIKDLSEEDLNTLFPPDEEELDPFDDDEYDSYDDDSSEDVMEWDGTWLEDEENWPDEWEQW